MNVDALIGYKGRTREALEKLGASIGCRIRLFTRDNIFIEGILMPKHEFSSPEIIVIKLDNGYNIGISIERVVKMDLVVCKGVSDISVSSKTAVEKIDGLPTTKILGCGGTIASKVEYETGAVKPAMEPSELLELVPELKGLANYEMEIVFNILSEDMTPSHWETIANKVYNAIVEGVDGIVITHGTDTMSYTAAALAFALRDLPMPISIVGAQRSSDRPSTDASLNLLAAVLTTLRAPFGEVVVVIHASPSDTEAYVHRGVKVRKMHSSRRDAFQSINDIPLAKVDLIKKELILINNRFLGRIKNRSGVIAQIGFDDRVALVKAYPGFQKEIIDFLVDKEFHGIVIEGTGLGHIGSYVIDSIKRAIEHEIPVVMTTQTLFGRVNMNVYTTGRKLLEIGVIPGEDMLPETAYVKLSWILKQTRNLSEIRKMMLTNYVNELNPISKEEYFPTWIRI